jgi:integrase
MVGPGKPWSATRKDGMLGVMRRVFADLHEWGWIERRFNAVRAFATPRAVKQQFRVAPRILEQDVWAKLLWAGLNLAVQDCPIQGSPPTDAEQAFHSFYPVEMIRAVALIWLFGGLRSDEIARLRVGCERMQEAVSGDRPDMERRMCLLDIPVQKRGPAFTKPVDALVGEAVAAWERVRPQQPAMVDRKTGEVVHPLFCFRAKRLSKKYLNNTLIPSLCHKAGIPREDARGSISSHRARSTIASQLYNAREPMSLFELQAWLGHQSPATTQHYVASSPTKLTQAYQEAGYFARNVRSIEVLIDREAISSGAAAAGEPWTFFDLGHGYCAYEFFDQCPHRMACAKCAYYVPKDSARAQILEGHTNLQRMLQEIPLCEDERAAVEEGIGAFEALQARLQDLPTPAGPTPRQLRGGPLPVVQ